MCALHEIDGDAEVNINACAYVSAAFVPIVFLLESWQLVTGHSSFCNQFLVFGCRAELSLLLFFLSPRFGAGH